MEPKKWKWEQMRAPASEAELQERGRSLKKNNERTLS